jgi:hypothetical protein
MYPTLLFVHSWLRWIVVGALIACVVASLRGGEFKSGRLRTVAVASLDMQVLFGIILYAIGPMTPRSREAFSAYMKISQLRFFTIEHGFAMIVALAVLHVFSARSRRAETDEKRHRALLIGASIALVAILIGIPWPGLPYGRPLFRLP